MASRQAASSSSSGGDQRLRHEPAAEVAEPAVLVGVPAGGGAVGVMALTPVISATARRGSPSFTSASPTSTARAPSATNRFTSCGPVMPDSATSTRSSGSQRREPAERVVVDLERLQVAGVDADELGAERHRALGLGLVVDLDQRGEAELAGLVVEAARAVVVERGDDQQRQVGAGGARLDTAGSS